jgi:hypothetical protein
LVSFIDRCAFCPCSLEFAEFHVFVQNFLFDLEGHIKLSDFGRELLNPRLCMVDPEFISPPSPQELIYIGHMTRPVGGLICLPLEPHLYIINAIVHRLRATTTAPHEETWH